MTKRTKLTRIIDSASGSKGETMAKESREQQTCGYKVADGVCGAVIHKSATSYSGWEHAEDAYWLHFATSEVTKHPRFLKCADCSKLPDENPQHFLLEGGHRFINAGVL